MICEVIQTNGYVTELIHLSEHLVFMHYVELNRIADIPTRYTELWVLLKVIHYCFELCYVISWWYISPNKIKH